QPAGHAGHHRDCAGHHRDRAGNRGHRPGRALMAPHPLEPAAIAALLEASLATIEAEVAALGAAASWRPAPGEWCANEVVGHLIEAERRGFAGRIRIILASERPALEGWDQPAVAAARHDCERSPGEL